MTRHRFVNEGAGVFAALVLAGCGSTPSETGSESRPGAEQPSAVRDYLFRKTSCEKRFFACPLVRANAIARLDRGHRGLRW